MRTTIDRSGRLVVPKVLRDRLALGEGGEVELLERDGVIEIQPAPAAVSLRSGAEGTVAHPVDDLPTLTDDVVAETTDRLRR